MTARVNVLANAALLESLERRALSCPFTRWLGVSFEDASEDEIRIRLPWRAEFIGRPDPPTLHGGVLASLIDIAGSNAVALCIGQPVPTVNLRIDYFRVPVVGDVVATARCVRAGRLLAHVDVAVRDAKNHVVAQGRGIFFSGEDQSHRPDWRAREGN